MIRRHAVRGALLCLLLLALVGCRADKPAVILATTTSTQDSGLLDLLVPAFEQQSGYRVKTVAVGSGQALALGERGEADVLLVHAPAAERRLIANGAATDRRLVMYNDFVLVGPPADPAGVAGGARGAGGAAGHAPRRGAAAAALQRIAAQGALFISRGDDSGTHRQELALWHAAGGKPSGRWYQESGSGMGQTLAITAEKGGYTLTDRATYLAQRRHLGLGIVLEGDPQLLNIYHVMLVNPTRFERVNGTGAQALADFLVSPAGQRLIGQFGVDKYGEPLFTPAAHRSEAELSAGL